MYFRFGEIDCPIRMSKGLTYNDTKYSIFDTFRYCSREHLEQLDAQTRSVLLCSQHVLKSQVQTHGKMESRFRRSFENIWSVNIPQGFRVFWRPSAQKNKHRFNCCFMQFLRNFCECEVKHGNCVFNFFWPMAHEKLTVFPFNNSTASSRFLSADSWRGANRNRELAVVLF